VTPEELAAFNLQDLDDVRALAERFGEELADAMVALLTRMPMDNRIAFLGLMFARPYGVMVGAVGKASADAVLEFFAEELRGTPANVEKVHVH